VLRRTFTHLISTIIELHNGDDATKGNFCSQTLPGLDFTYKIVLEHHIQQTDAYLDIVHAMQCIIHLIYKTNYLYMHSIHDINTGLFEITVGVLTTCHTQYT
jgi:hypothetical protein